MWNTFIEKKNPLIFFLYKRKGWGQLLFLHVSIVVCNFAHGGKFDGRLSECFWKGDHSRGRGRVSQWWWEAKYKSTITTPDLLVGHQYLPYHEADSGPGPSTTFCRWKCRSYTFTSQCLLSSAIIKNINGPLLKVELSIEIGNIMRFGWGAVSDYLHHYFKRVELPL